MNKKLQAEIIKRFKKPLTEKEKEWLKKHPGKFLPKDEKLRKTLEMEMETDKEKEEYLFKIARKILEWGEVEYCEEELADLIMLELLDVK